MDILELHLEVEAALGNLFLDLVEPEPDRLAIGLTEDALAHQHGGMGPAAGDILSPEPAVDADGGVDPLHDLRRATGETPAPHAILGGALVGRRSFSGALGGRALGGGRMRFLDAQAVSPSSYSSPRLSRGDRGRLRARRCPAFGEPGR